MSLPSIQPQESCPKSEVRKQDMSLLLAIYSDVYVLLKSE